MGLIYSLIYDRIVEFTIADASATELNATPGELSLRPTHTRAYQMQLILPVEIISPQRTGEQKARRKRNLCISFWDEEAFERSSDGRGRSSASLASQVKSIA